MRVVTDTNVIVSALLWMGAPQKILIAAEKAQVTLCVSPALLQELVGVLERPKFTQRLRNLRVSATELMSSYVCLAHVVLPQPSHLRHLYETYSISCNAPPRYSFSCQALYEVKCAQRKVGKTLRALSRIQVLRRTA